MATNKNLGSHEMLDEEDEVELVMEESSVVDSYEMENEVTELELDDDESDRDRNVESEIKGNPAASSPDTLAEFLPLEKAKSPVWRFFGFPSRSGEYVEKDKRRRKEVFCTLCKLRLNYTGSTTNMIVHLQYRHVAEYNELVSLLQKSKSSEQTKLSKLQLPRGQLSIAESFGKVMPLTQSSTRWKRLTSAVCQFLAKDLVPIDAGFWSMLKVFEPRYTFPDRTTFSRHYLPSLYQKQKALVFEQMASGLKYFALTTDCWTSRAQHSFMSLTVHYISAEWNLQSHMLETGEITTEHTAVNLSSYLQESLGRWNLHYLKGDDLLLFY